MHDLVLSGGHVVDGTGGPAFRADVAVTEGRIAALGRTGPARRVIDVSGHLVAPGFVDMHSHSDLALLAEPTADAKVMQGVTGEVIGQDGLAYAPLDDFTLAAVRIQTAGWVGDPVGLDYGWRSVAEYLGAIRGVATVAERGLPRPPRQPAHDDGGHRRPSRDWLRAGRDARPWCGAAWPRVPWGCPRASPTHRPCMPALTNSWSCAPRSCPSAVTSRPTRAATGVASWRPTTRWSTCAGARRAAAPHALPGQLPGQ